MRPTLLLIGALLLRIGLDARWLFADPAAFVEVEEGWNATVAWMLVHGDLGGALLDLRWKEFCGGCTVVTVVGAGPLAVFGDALWAWKLQAFAWTAGTTVFGWLALRRMFGETAAATWALLCAIPPPGLSAQGLVLFGNHHEVMLLVTLALYGYSSRRAWVVGGAVGFGVAFCRTGLMALPLLLAAAWVHRKEPRKLGELAISWAIGVSWILLPSATGDSAGYDLAAVAGDPLRRVLALGDPAVVGERLFGGAIWAAVPLLIAGGIALVQTRRSVVAALPLMFAAGFVVSGVPLPESVGEVVWINGRYWGPWALGLALVVAASRWRLVLAPPLLLAALASRPTPGASEMPPATDLVFFASEATHRLDLETLHAATGDDLDTELTLRLLEGIAVARTGRISAEPRIQFGVGLHRAREPHADLEPPLDVWMGRGMAANLMAHLGPEAPTSEGLDAAGGAALLARCGKKRDCLRAALSGATAPEELAFGYGLAVGPLPRVEADALAEVLGEDFVEGVEHPLSGLRRPVGVDLVRDVPLRR